MANQAPVRNQPEIPFEIFRRHNALLETSLAISKILVLATVFLTVFLSVLAGAEPFWIVVRGSVALLSVGLALWIVNLEFTKRVMASVMEDVKKTEEELPVSTVELRA